MASIISAGTTSGTALNFTGDTSGNLQFKTGAGANTITVPNVTGTLALTGGAVTTSQLPVGTVLQVVSIVNTSTYSSSSTTPITPTGMTASITPTSSTSKILVIARISCSGSVSGSITLRSQLVRNSTALDGSYPSTTPTASISFATERFWNYLDSPATTSSTSYSIQFWGDGATWYSNLNAGTNLPCESTITLMEIAG